MVVRIRLARHGVRNRPFYHIVVCNAWKAPRAKPLETIGTFDPIPKKEDPKDIIPRIKDLELNVQRFKYWVSVGAQPSDTVRSLAEKFQLLPKKPTP